MLIKNQFLKILLKVYMKIFLSNIQVKFKCEQDNNKASETIYEILMSNKPCMIARFGAIELGILKNYLGIKKGNASILKYIQGKELDWWWNDSLIKAMNTNAGFFPSTIKKTEQFCELMLQDISEVDILGSWLADEKLFENELQNAEKTHLRLLEPFWSDQPWSRVLEGKKVLIVHPFAQTILNQYKNRELLFNNKNTLPEFKSIKVIQAVQSIGAGDSRFEDWFEALKFMKDEIDKQDYDICLIGAGAYGFPLAAHVKRSGKKAVHMGGVLQLLFGIKGKRWEDPNYGVSEWGIEYGAYTNLMNEYWVRPDENEKPATADSVEGACYW